MSDSVTTTVTDPVAGDRPALILSTVTRAARTARRVFGYSSLTAGCAELPPAARGKTKGWKGKGPGGKVKKKGDEHRVPPWWDRICVEGDAEWTKLPGARPKEKKARAKKGGVGGGRRKGKGGDAVVDMAEKAKKGAKE